MIKRKLLVVLTVFCTLFVRQTIKAQVNSIVPVLLNEYSASNVGMPLDNYGQQSDWVEIYNAHTQLVSLGGYYLSNDRLNLFKWKFPSTFIMGVGTYSVVWLSGRNTSSAGHYHANFTIDQCKNQWLILTSPDGVIRDSVFVQKTKAGHSWGRVDYQETGISAWRLYTSPSFMFANPQINNYRGYAPKPAICITPANNPAVNNKSPNTGEFNENAASMFYFKLEDPVLAYDTIFHSCYDIFYTTNGSYPQVSYPPVAPTKRVLDSVTTSAEIIPGKAIMIRAIAVLSPTMANCPNYLPSFCETNTYFFDPTYQNFKKEYGVLSLAMDSLWFLSNGLPANQMVHAEFYDNEKQVTEGYGLITRPPNESWVTKQKGFNITIDDKQGFGCNFEGNIFNVEGLGVSSRTVFPTLQVYAGDNESHSEPGFLPPASGISHGTGIRDVFIQTLSDKYGLNVNPLHMKPVVVFRNGRYSGMYTMKEVYDKYYENYYHKQALDSLDLAYYYNTDGFVSYGDGSVSRISPPTAFKSEVYNVTQTTSMNSNTPFWKAVSAALDTSSLIDYMAVNSFVLNSDLWTHNIAFGRGANKSKPGGKWHYYLWNMPTIFSFTGALAFAAPVYSNTSFQTCVVYTPTYVVSPPFSGNGHGMMMRKFMGGFGATVGNTGFQIAYKNRYNDLLNTAFNCDNLLKHYDYVYELYGEGMRFHELPVNEGEFFTAENLWDTSALKLRKLIEGRCNYVKGSFGQQNCYRMDGPYELLVNVEPAGSGTVKLNSIYLENYPWKGTYYSFPGQLLAFKATPTNTTFAFDHWEVMNNRPRTALSVDSLSLDFIGPDEVTAVFTDKSRDLEAGVNVPTGFTPNGDGRNDTFGPLGSGKFATNYDMTIWSRWGQQVFHATDPSQRWDGYFNGQLAITGVYAYIIKYRDIYGEDKMLKGNVTLTR